MKNLLLIMVLTVNTTVTLATEKEDKPTRTERRLERRKAKAIANVKKWKQESHGTSVMMTQIAPNK